MARPSCNVGTAREEQPGGGRGHTASPQPRPRTKAWKKHWAWWGGQSQAAPSLALSLLAAQSALPLLQARRPPTFAALSSLPQPSS